MNDAEIVVMQKKDDDIEYERTQVKVNSSKRKMFDPNVF